MPANLVLLRHGQSQWNLENRFTGWWDVDLTPRGEAEATAAGRALAAAGLDFDFCLTSVQTRAIRTLNLALHAMDRLWLPVAKDWRLNERHYGALTGLDKAETAARHGEEQVRLWRRSFAIAPPPMEPANPYDLSADPQRRPHLEDLRSRMRSEHDAANPDHPCERSFWSSVDVIQTAKSRSADIIRSAD